jgi:NO-binding membrane sensor protein with MHYT domain
LLTNVMHWGYGTGWGAIYGAVMGTRARERPLVGGLVFGTGVWVMSYVQMVPLGIYEPPWKYTPQELAMDLSYHLAYGAGLGTAGALLEG